MGRGVACLGLLRRLPGWLLETAKHWRGAGRSRRQSDGVGSPRLLVGGSRASSPHPSPPEEERADFLLRWRGAGESAWGGHVRGGHSRLPGAGTHGHNLVAQIRHETRNPFPAGTPQIWRGQKLRTIPVCPRGNASSDLCPRGMDNAARKSSDIPSSEKPLGSKTCCSAPNICFGATS